ncbi:MAG: T9SS type A sorting domain-containing protein [Candidatus Cloacimonetes bacterium]|nr:T9SS type A sorting domain-containing protein [Candidatus Cloacimonadota bacterium]
MKKVVLSFFLVCVALLSAELIVDIPFTPDQVGPAYSTQGDYTFDFPVFTITNTGETQTYTINQIYDENLIPNGWSMIWCTDGLCHMANWPSPIEILANEEKEIEMHVSVYNQAGEFDFTFEISGGDLTDPIINNFSFKTEDATSANPSVPAEVLSLDAYPNPFNPSTSISLNIPAKDMGKALSANIYNAKGQLVKTLVDAQATTQTTYVWDGVDNNGTAVTSGLYFVKVQTASSSTMKKIMMVK